MKKQEKKILNKHATFIYHVHYKIYVINIAINRNMNLQSVL